MTAKAADKPTRWSLFQYSLLALPLAFAGLPLYIHAPDFYTRDLGMNIGLIGIILLFVRILDAVQDPLIGYISDKHAHKRFAIVASGAGMLFAGMGGIFIGPQLAIPIAIWFALAMILATTGFSIVTINLNMIGGFWHDSPQERTRISAWREALTLVGLLVASVLPAALQNFRPAEGAFKIMFIVFGVIMVSSFIMFTRFMRRISAGHAINKNDANKGFSFLQIITGKDRNFFIACFFTHLSAAIPGVMVLFFIRDYLGEENLSGLFLFLYFMSGAILMPVWVKLAARIGKYKAWLASMILAVVTFIGAYFLSPGDAIAYGIICVLSGTALGADLALPPSIVADRITTNKTESDATQYYALLAFIPKAAIALASGVAFITLDALGFTPAAENSVSVMTGIITIYALIPCLIKLIAAALLWRVYIKEGDFYEPDHSHTSARGGTHV